MSIDLLQVLEESRSLGFLGPGPVERHVHHANAFIEAVDRPPERAIDIGAGGGLPGLVIAATDWVEVRWTLLDSMTRRTAFLQWAVRELDIADRVEVVTGRAEEVGHEPLRRSSYDLVTARSFGAPAVTAECAAGFLKVGGHLVVSEPPDADETRWPARELEKLSLGDLRSVVVPGSPPTHLVRMTLVSELDDRFPRRTGLPGKRPLF